MRCIGVGRVRDIQHAEFEPFLLPVLLGQFIIIFRRSVRSCCTVPIGVVINILPKVKMILRKLVRIRRVLNKSIPVVASNVDHLCVCAKRWVSLGCSKWGIPLLQRHPRSQQLCIRISCRTPVRNMAARISMYIRLIGTRRTVSCKRPRIAGVSR